MPSLSFFGTEGMEGTLPPTPIVHSGLQYDVNIAASSTAYAAVWSTPLSALDVRLVEQASRGAPDAVQRGSFNASAILAMEQRNTIRLLAACTSTVSITAVTCAVYWFYMMRRNFRRDLVMLLILGDFWKSLWLLIFACVTFTFGQISTASDFCQASGYMLQMAIEMCDLAIFFMSLHTWLQIFPPSSSIFGHDGLYRVRKWIVAIWFILPNVSAALAFAKAGAAYEAAGAFCTLPVRPYWYRLALSWVPRYLIWLFIMFVAIRIYRHLGKEFRVFGWEEDRSNSLSMLGESPKCVTNAAAGALGEKRRKSGLIDSMSGRKRPTPEDDVAPDDMSIRAIRSPGLPKPSPPDSTNSPPQSRRPSAPDWSAAFGFPNEPLNGPQSINSNSSSRRGSRQVVTGVLVEDFAAPPSPHDPNRHRSSITTLNSVKSSGTQSNDDGPALAPILENKRDSSTTTTPSLQHQPQQSHQHAHQQPPDAATAALQLRRRAIQRQLRLLFIYPLVYMILWALPFAAHAMNYNDHFAQHPSFPLQALNIFCQCFLGTVDVTVFCWREKPWCHIPGSSGTFLGSFCFWRFCLGRRTALWWRRRREGLQWRESCAPGYGSEGVGDEKFDFTAAAAAAAVDDHRNEKSQSRARLLTSLKRWSLSIRTSSPRGSDVSGAATVAAAAPVVAQRVRPVVHRRVRSGGSDRRHLEAERAHERLVAERADYERQRRSLQGRRSSVMEVGIGSGSSPPREERRKEWWDREVEEDLGVGESV